MTDARFTHLVSNWLDGSLTESESNELQSALSESVDRRRLFADLCGLDSDLREMCDVDSPLIDAESGRSEAPKDQVSFKHAIRWGLLAAIAAGVLIAIGFGFGRLGFDNSDRLSVVSESEIDVQVDSEDSEEDKAIESGCAVLTKIVDATFGDGATYREGDSLLPGKLELLSGAVQVDFFSGATMLLGDQTSVNLISSREAECLRGKVTVHVPPPAIGFRLTLPGMKVVDLGTEFGVEVGGGESSVHVFDGEVEAHVPGSSMQIIRQGQSLGATEGKTLVPGTATPDRFPNARQFEERLQASYEKRSNQWWESMVRVRSDDRILGCYLFKRWEDERWDRLVNNFSLPRFPSRAGSAVGTRWVEGRWPTKAAMEFKNPGDRVSINLGKEAYDGLTMAAWIRVDALQQRFSALMLTDGYENGEPHWQIDQSGRLMFSVSYAPSVSTQVSSTPLRENQVYFSPAIFGGSGRRWRHVAVTYDATTSETIQYVDGEEVSREKHALHREGQKVRFGSCAIGNWGVPKDRASFPVRNLNGRIDEFLIYRDVLDANEITELYQLGNTIH